MKNNDKKIKASTQEHLDIDDVVDDMIILKNGWVAMILATTAVNFDILSEAEQDATIYAYGALLNSLTFPLQVLIRSKKADITAYYQHLVEAEGNQPNPDLKVQIRKYREFVQSTVQQKTILDKRFYLVIHFSPLELGVKSFKKTDTANKKSKAQLVADSRASLLPKRDHLVKQTARLGLFTRQLSTQEIIELMYDIYNPAPTGTQRVILDAASYTTPLVEPDLEIPTPEPEAVAQELPSAEGMNPVNEPGAGEADVEPAPGGSPGAESTGALWPQTQDAMPNLVSQPQPIILPKTVQVTPVANPAVEPISTPVTIPGAGGQVAGGGQQDALRNLKEAMTRASRMGKGVGGR